MEDINRIRDDLRRASSLPGLLAAAWQGFEAARAVCAAAAGLSPGLYPAFTFARGEAASGSESLAAAPSLPVIPAGSRQLTAPAGTTAAGAAGAVADLAAELRTRLGQAARSAPGAADRAACAAAARHAGRLRGLLAGQA